LYCWLKSIVRRLSGGSLGTAEGVSGDVELKGVGPITTFIPCGSSFTAGAVGNTELCCANCRGGYI